MTATLTDVQRKSILFLDQFIDSDTLPDPYLGDVWVINHPDSDKVKSFLNHIIHSNEISLYLKPIFLQEDLKESYGVAGNYIRHLCDGYISDLDLTQKVPLIERVNEYIRRYEEVRHEALYSSNAFISQKVFDYYFTRQDKIVPVHYHQSHSGYCYPRIEAHYRSGKEAYCRTIQLLDNAVEEGWVSRSYMDTSHLCHHCNSGFLNYREVCTKCDSSHLKTEKIIHHYRCAHVGPESDYIHNGRLICPKCSMELKNLGIDYDKPGEMFSCNDCKHQFQEAPVKASCAYCDTEQNTYDLETVAVYQYRMGAEEVIHFNNNTVENVSFLG